MAADERRTRRRRLALPSTSHRSPSVLYPDSVHSPAPSLLSSTSVSDRQTRSSAAVAEQCSTTLIRKRSACIQPSLYIYLIQESLANAKVSARQPCWSKTDFDVKLAVKIILGHLFCNLGRFRRSSHSSRQKYARYSIICCRAQ